MKSWRAASSVLLVTLALGASPGAAAATLGDGVRPPPARDAVQVAQPFLDRPSATTAPLPADPDLALVKAARSLLAALGVQGDPAVAVGAAELPPAVAGNIALVLDGIVACHQRTAAHLAAMPPPVLAAAAGERGNGGGLDPESFSDIRQCALGLWGSTNQLEVALTASTAPPGELDIWPVVRFSGADRDDVYLNDYALIIDAGGDDTYANNAGANLIDPNFGPPGQPGVRGEGPARGCQRAVPAITAADCIPSAALLLDLAGNDTYGVKQSPDVDAECTADPVIRRMVTNGSGFLGVGILFDRSGDDRYTGKTVSNGSGHVFGVGVLHDLDGNDRYADVRNSTGFALVGGLGVFRDHAGNDSHDFSIPSPLNRLAPNQTPGAGGVIDDQGVCDNLPRYNVGGGNVGGVGVAVDDAGDDRYRGGFTPDFLAPAGTGPGGSQGFGSNGGSGVLVDRAGSDTYKLIGDEGRALRGDGVTILPGAATTGSGGLFRDS